MPFRKAPSPNLFSRPARELPSDALVVHIDGGARGNPGPSGYGVVVHDARGNLVTELSEYLGHRTNNFAEYSALLAALEYARQNNHAAMKVYSDSELLVKQIKGEYKVKSPDLKPLYEDAMHEIRRFDWFEVEHVLRERNREADRLANEAMDRGMRAAFPRGENRNPSANRDRIESPRELTGIVRGGKVEFIEGSLPEGTRVRVTPAKE